MRTRELCSWPVAYHGIRPSPVAAHFLTCKGEEGTHRRTGRRSRARASRARHTAQRRCGHLANRTCAPPCSCPWQPRSLFSDHSFLQCARLGRRIEGAASRGGLPPRATSRTHWPAGQQLDCSERDQTSSPLPASVARVDIVGRCARRTRVVMHRRARWCVHSTLINAHARTLITPTSPPHPSTLMGTFH